MVLYASEFCMKREERQTICAGAWQSYDDVNPRESVK